MKNQNIKFKKGDLLKAFDDDKFDCIAHQCNTKLASNECGGIAGAIFNRYETAYYFNNSLINGYKSERFKLLGMAKMCNIGMNRYVCNIYSQYDTGSPTVGIDSMSCRLSYLEQGLCSINAKMKAYKLNKLGIPLIGSGLAKQDYYYNIPDLEYFKKFVLLTVKKVFKDTNIQVTIMYL